MVYVFYLYNPSNPFNKPGDRDNLHFMGAKIKHRADPFLEVADSTLEYRLSALMLILHQFIYCLCSLMSSV